MCGGEKGGGEKCLYKARTGVSVTDVFVRDNSKLFDLVEMCLIEIKNTLDRHERCKFSRQNLCSLTCFPNLTTFHFTRKDNLHPSPSTRSTFGVFFSWCPRRQQRWKPHTQRPWRNTLMISWWPSSNLVLAAWSKCVSLVCAWSCLPSKSDQLVKANHSSATGCLALLPTSLKVHRPTPTEWLADEVCCLCEGNPSSDVQTCCSFIVIAIDRTTWSYRTTHLPLPPKSQEQTACLSVRTWIPLVVQLSLPEDSGTFTYPLLLSKRSSFFVLFHRGRCCKVRSILK